VAQSLSKIIAPTKDARLRIRLLAVSHFNDGKSRTQIAKYLKVSRTSVNKWVKSYLDYGVEGLHGKKHPGRNKALSDEQLLTLKAFITAEAVKADGGRLQGKDVQAYILNEFGVNYQKSNVYKLLHALNFSWITTRSKHPKQNIEAQEAFKKIPNKNDP